MITKFNLVNPLDTGRKLNVYKLFRKRPDRLLSVSYTFNLRPVSRGKATDNVEAEIEDVRSSIIKTPRFDKDDQVN